MSDQHEDDAFSSGFDALHGIVQRLEEGLLRRLGSIGDAWSGLDQTLMAITMAPGGTPRLLGLAALVCSVTVVVFFGLRRLLRGRAGFAAGFSRTVELPVALLGGALAGVLAGRVMTAGPSPMQTTLTIAAVGTALTAALLCAQSMLIDGARMRKNGQASARAQRFVLHLNLVIGYAITGAAALSILRAWGAGPPARDLLGSAFVAAPVTIGLVAVTFIHRTTLAALVAGPKPRSGRRARLARSWPPVLMAIVGMTFVSAQLAQTLGTPLPGLAIIATLAAVIALPILDRILKGWTADGLATPGMPVARLAARMTIRPALLAAIASLLCALWLGPLLTVGGDGLQRFLYTAVTLAILGLGASFCWNLISIASARALRQDDDAEPADEETLTPRTRFQTLAPLLAGIARWSIAAVGVLSALIVLGINVWPIVTGLSVFGIAIGFGSQALVKDVVSGVFFLIDDAFRQGEYIETSGAKGVVEKISIRSVSLRHQRGALATIPYGSIGKIQNFSRDWVIEKLLFRVAIDTDVEAVRKMFKKIGQELALDPELAPDLIEPFKSQGIAELDDGTLVVRGKFKAKAGRQALIRRKVLAEVHKSFQENGIRAVPKPLDAARPAG